MKNIKKIVCILAAAAMLLSLAACSGNDNSETTNGTTVSTTSSSDPDTIGVTKPGSESGTMIYDYTKFGYEVTYPDNFTVLNQDGNMVEFRTASGADFTILVLDNRYDSVKNMIEGEKEDEAEVIDEGDDYFVLYTSMNGRTTYTYYYCGNDMITCELTYPDTVSSEMEGLQNIIKVVKK